MFISKEHHTGLERLTELVDQGRLTPVIERTYPLSDVPAAMRQLVAGTVRGKVVIVP